MKTELIADETEQRLVVKTSEDVTDQLDFNKHLFNSGDGYSPSRELRRVASIPNSVVEMWMNLYGVNVFDKDHAPAVKRLLNSNEWQWLRTAPGRF